jgi:hypothetical protein
MNINPIQTSNNLSVLRNANIILMNKKLNDELVD